MGINTHNKRKNTTVQFDKNLKLNEIKSKQQLNSIQIKTRAVNTHYFFFRKQDALKSRIKTNDIISFKFVTRIAPSVAQQILFN